MHHFHHFHASLRRWFDKCLNLIVAENGRAGVSWEHAWGDGVAVLNFFNAVHGAMEGAGELSDSSLGVSPAPFSILSWNLDDRGRAACASAEAKAVSDASGLALRVFQTDSLNKDDIKRSGLSPDGVMQMALQLAHWKVHVGGSPPTAAAAALLPATYESASTAAYKHGRTETIRRCVPPCLAHFVLALSTKPSHVAHTHTHTHKQNSATPEALAMCQVFANPSANPSLKFQTLSLATERHRALTIDGVQGAGCDRHLFALRVLAEKPGTLGVGRGGGRPPTLPLFSHPSYAHFTDIRLSTSTMASSALDGGGFGPVNDHSYAVSYGVEERGCHFHIMARTREGGGRANGLAAREVSTEFSGDLDVYAFAEATEQALRDIVSCTAAVKGFTPRGGTGGFKK